MGEFAQALDAYLTNFEHQKGVSLRVPEKLAQRKAAADRLDEKNGVTNLNKSATQLRDHSLIVDAPIEQQRREAPRGFALNESGSEPITNSELDQFDIDRIDDRLRALGVDPDCVHSEYDDNSLANYDFTEMDSNYGNM